MRHRCGKFGQFTGIAGLEWDEDEQTFCVSIITLFSDTKDGRDWELKYRSPSDQSYEASMFRALAEGIYDDYSDEIAEAAANYKSLCEADRYDLVMGAFA